MGLYKNTNGVLTPIAGKGKAEYGASTVRKGTVTFSSISGNYFSLKDVVFDEPMPDSDYLILFINGSSGWAFYDAVYITQNGFKLCAVNTSDSALSGLTVDYIAYKLYTDNEYNGLLNNQRYSTDEIDTGKVWIDGKKIYRKVLQTTMPTVETDGTYVTTTVAHGISGTKDLISLDAMVQSYYQGGSLHYGYNANTAWGSANDVKYSVYTQFNGANILIGSNRSAMNNMKVFIILEYTKTTD